MKKLVLSLAVIASVSMISCTNNNAEQAEVTEDTTAVVDEVVDSAAVAPVDSAAVVDSTAAAPVEEAPAEEAK